MEDEIERMVSEAEKYKAEDDANKNRIEAKNGLENYCYSLKSSISSDEVKDKIPAEDKAALETAIEDYQLVGCQPERREGRIRREAEVSRRYRHAYLAKDGRWRYARWRHGRYGRCWRHARHGRCSRRCPT